MKALAEKQASKKVPVPESPLYFSESCPDITIKAGGSIPNSISPTTVIRSSSGPLIVSMEEELVPDFGSSSEDGDGCGAEEGQGQGEGEGEKEGKDSTNIMFCEACHVGVQLPLTLSSSSSSSSSRLKRTAGDRSVLNTAVDVRSSSSSNEKNWGCSHCGNCAVGRTIPVSEQKNLDEGVLGKAYEKAEIDGIEGAKEGVDKGKGYSRKWDTDIGIEGNFRAHRVMVNFRELLWYWREYYLRRGRDRLSIEFSSHIPFSQWNALVGELMSSSICLPVHLSACLSVCLSAYPSV